jgi:hypothetical protein
MGRAVSAAILLLSVALPTSAADMFGDRLTINGFASQAFIDTQENNYLVPDSQDGSLAHTEFGLTFNSQVSDKLRVGGQLLARKLGDEGNLLVKLDWGFGEYAATDWLKLRAGKIKLPIGLYNEERDLDFVRPMAFLPQGVYDELTRDFLTAGNGVGAAGNIGLGSAGDLDYAVFVGELQVSDETTLVRYQKSYISNAAQESFGVPVTDYESRSDTSVAARVVYNTPLSGLRVGASYADVSAYFELGAFGNSFSQILQGTGIPGTTGGGFRDNWILSAEYLSERLDLRGEFKRFHTETDTFGQVGEDGDTEAWYVMGTVHIPGTDQLGVTVVYDVFTRFTDREHDPEDAHNDKKDLGVGLRWDVTGGFALKAEYHTVSGAASVFDTWSEFNREQGLANDWSYYIVKSSFAF